MIWIAQRDLSRFREGDLMDSSRRTKVTCWNRNEGSAQSQSSFSRKGRYFRLKVDWFVFIALFLSLQISGRIGQIGISSPLTTPWTAQRHQRRQHRIKFTDKGANLPQFDAPGRQSSRRSPMYLSFLEERWTKGGWQGFQSGIIDQTLKVKDTQPD